MNTSLQPQQSALAACEVSCYIETVYTDIQHQTIWSNNKLSLALQLLPRNWQTYIFRVNLVKNDKISYLSSKRIVLCLYVATAVCRDCITSMLKLRVTTWLINEDMMIVVKLYSYLSEEDWVCEKTFFEDGVHFMFPTSCTATSCNAPSPPGVHPYHSWIASLPLWTASLPLWTAPLPRRRTGCIKRGSSVSAWGRKHISHNVALYVMFLNI